MGANPQRHALQLHDRLLREHIFKRGGYEVKTEGDAFMVAFTDPLDAVAWCLTTQEALMVADWPKELQKRPESAEVHAIEGNVLLRGLRVRMGAHLGRPDCRPDPTTGRMDYFGPVVNRASRGLRPPSG